MQRNNFFTKNPSVTYIIVNSQDVIRWRIYRYCNCIACEISRNLGFERSCVHRGLDIVLETILKYSEESHRMIVVMFGKKDKGSAFLYQELEKAICTNDISVIPIFSEESDAAIGNLVETKLGHSNDRIVLMSSRYNLVRKVIWGKPNRDKKLRLELVAPDYAIGIVNLANLEGIKALIFDRSGKSYFIKPFISGKKGR